MSDAQRGAASQLIFQMLDRRLRLRENQFPEERPACLDDLVFLPAILSRLVIDPYREAWSRSRWGVRSRRQVMSFAPDRNEEERTDAVVNILEANAGEASMMARCAGKTRLHNIEPEDLRSIDR